MPLRVGVIVEGHGEVASISTLLQRIWRQQLRGDFLEVIPFRQPRGTLLKEEGLKNAVDTIKFMLGLNQPVGMHSMVLILIDAEDMCPKELAPRLVGWANEARSDADVACVLPNPMFETWFAASASSMAGVNGLPSDLAVPDDPEGNRLGKSWIKDHYPRGRKYSETVDQPRFTAKIDLAGCRDRSPSFDKLCRELEKRLPTSPDT